MFPKMAQLKIQTPKALTKNMLVIGGRGSWRGSPSRVCGWATAEIKFGAF